MVVIFLDDKDRRRANNVKLLELSGQKTSEEAGNLTRMHQAARQEIHGANHLKERDLVSMENR